jgi:hypothetical protein
LEDKPRVEEYLHRASLGQRWSRSVYANIIDVETGMGDVVLGGDQKEER